MHLSCEWLFLWGFMVYCVSLLNIYYLNISYISLYLYLNWLYIADLLIVLFQNLLSIYSLLHNLHCLSIVSLALSLWRSASAREQQNELIQCWNKVIKCSLCRFFIHPIIQLTNWSISFFNPLLWKVFLFDERYRIYW